MQAGTYGEGLRRIADLLCAEFVTEERSDIPGARPTLAEEGTMAGALDAEDEALVAHLRLALARIAASTRTASDPQSWRVVEIALDGAEFVIRDELATGHADRVLDLMPSFVFLVVNPVTDQARALELSRRTAEIAAQIDR